MNAGKAFAFLIPLSLASSLSGADEPPPAPPAKGLVVFVDPVTGKIRQPDPSEIGALTAPPPGSQTSKPAAEPPLQMKFGPDGSVGLVLDSRYESAMVVTKKPDGTLAMECVTGSRMAEEAVLAGEKTPVKEKKGAKEAPRGR